MGHSVQDQAVEIIMSVNKFLAINNNLWDKIWANLNLNTRKLYVCLKDLQCTVLVITELTKDNSGRRKPLRLVILLIRKIYSLQLN